MINCAIPLYTSEFGPCSTVRMDYMGGELRVVVIFSVS